MTREGEGGVAAPAGLYERPVLALDPGMHTAALLLADVDRAGGIAVTGAHDKTVRLWRVADGTSLRTIRMPTGPGNVGKIYAVAISPDGGSVAAGGWTHVEQEQIYLFDAGTGRMTGRLAGLPDVVFGLAFSPDGSHLAASLGSGGMLLYRAEGDCWTEVARDTDGGQSYGVAFASDGRFATTSLDGRLRLYDPDGQRLGPPVDSGFECPFALAFNPQDGRLAVGFDGTAAVRIFDGDTLAPLAAPDTDGIDNGDLSKVAWSADGATLFAAGSYDEGSGERPVVQWDAHGTQRHLPGSLNTVMSLRPLPDGGLLVASADPFIGVVDADGTQRWTNRPVQMDPRGQRHNLGVSSDGMVVDFGFERWGKRRARFDVAALRLGPPQDDGRTVVPAQDTLPIANWEDSRAPTLGKLRLPLERHEWSRSLGIHPDGESFVLGAGYWLRAFDASGTKLWRRAVPGIVWAVNIAAERDLVVAAYNDGTIRWHRLDNGAELLAFFPFADDSDRWVLWTPEGYYYSAPGAGETLGWVVNRGWDQAADVFPITAFPGFFAPEALRHVPAVQDTPRALGLAKVAGDRKAVQEAVDSPAPPGPQLHALAIGISRYQNHESLKLDFAAIDAHDLARALLRQEGALFTRVNVEPLTDEDATKLAIGAALTRLAQRMTPEQGDVAIIHFSGHGEIIGEDYYLLPHDVDAANSHQLDNSGLHIGELRRRVSRMSEQGKVLVLLDACHSGAVVDGAKSHLPPDITTVREQLAKAGPGAIVLSSSSHREVSCEHPDWQNGAFTEVILAALDGAADLDGDGWLTVSEFNKYVVENVRTLTGGAQNPKISTIGEHHFEARLFRTGF